MDPATDGHIHGKPEYELPLTHLPVPEDATSIPPLNTAIHAKSQCENFEAPSPSPALRFARPVLRTLQTVLYHLPRHEHRMFLYLA